MKIRAIFFDLDDTLHDHLQPFSQTIKQVFPVHYKTVSIEALYKKFREASDLLWKDYSRNQLTLEELRVERIKIALKSIGVSITTSQAFQFQQQYEFQSNHLEMFSYVPNLLLQLQNKGLQLGIVTNGPTEHQLAKIKSLGLTAFFSRDLLFISDEVGAAKPDPAIFHYAAKKVHKACEELVYIGDNWENDVVAPIMAGWQSIWFNHRKRQPLSDHKPLAEIECLSEVFRKLDTPN